MADYEIRVVPEQRRATVNTWVPASRLNPIGYMAPVEMDVLEADLSGTPALRNGDSLTASFKTISLD